MEKSVEQFLRSVRNAENATETRSTEPSGINSDKASCNAIRKTKNKKKTGVKKEFHCDAIRKTKNKKKTGVKKEFHCDICNVKMYGVGIFVEHLKGKKHQKKKVPLSKSSEGIEYIRRYEQSDDNVIIKCELCAEQLLDVVKHLDSSSHVLAFLKANYPKVLESLQSRGLHNISETEMKRIALEETYREELQQYADPDNPVQMESIFFHHQKWKDSKPAANCFLKKRKCFNMKDQGDEKIRRHKDCDPPQKMLRIDDPPYNDVSATNSDHTRGKKCGLDENEKKCSTSDEEREVNSDYQECKKSNTGCNLEDNRFESPYKITCNDDFYNFLQYFQISDETDVVFIQKIVENFKSQLQEFFENTKEEKEVLDLNGSKNDTLKIAHPAENFFQQADSTTSNESIISSTDIVDQCAKADQVDQGEITTSSIGTIGSDLPVCDTSNGLSIDKMNCIIRPSTLSSALKSSELPLESHELIKKEPDTVASDEYPDFKAGYAGTKNTLDHSLEFGRDESPSTHLESSSTANKNECVPAVEKPTRTHLNCPPSPVTTDDTNSITFGGKKNMHISELKAEVAKFANSKPILKGIDINQVVRLIIQNRREKTRKENHDIIP